MQRIKKLLLVTALVIIGLSWAPSGSLAPFAALVSAHSLEQDGPISAVLHIAPDDDPTAGVETTAALDFTSSDSDFNINDYAITVRLNGTSVDTSVPDAPIEPDGSDATSGTVRLTFPKPGTYSLVVTGTPTHKGRPFSLKFSVRAERPTVASQSGGLSGTINSASFDSILAGVASFGLLLIVARYQMNRGGRYR